MKRLKKSLIKNIGIGLVVTVSMGFIFTSLAQAQTTITIPRTGTPNSGFIQHYGRDDKTLGIA